MSLDFFLSGVLGKETEEQRHTELSGGRSTRKSHKTFETEDFAKKSLIPSALL